jgi:eukaryotic-like serine/threonine-protein kinase
VFVVNSDAQPPFERRPTSGFRCAKYLGDLKPELLAAVDLWFNRDYSKERPADDATFSVYRRFYQYDKQDLKAKVDAVDDSSEFWRKETVSYTAAYGDERIIAHVLLPKTGKPPYQAVVYFPGQDALSLAEIPPAHFRWFDFIIRSGRALIYPVYKGTYQRRITASFEVPSVRRDLMMYWAKDIGRSIDYLETRPDIDATRIAYTGLSRGATDAPIYGAVEPRIKTLVLLYGGFPLSKPLPEADPINFALRVKAPTLMVNGRYDFNYPLEQSQKYLYRWLGTPEKDKRHVLLEAGHGALVMQPVIKETLNWLDKYLGPVQH